MAQLVEDFAVAIQRADGRKPQAVGSAETAPAVNDNALAGYEAGAR